jgi:hypothetical protein
MVQLVRTWRVLMRFMSLILQVPVLPRSTGCLYKSSYQLRSHVSFSLNFCPFHFNVMVWVVYKYNHRCIRLLTDKMLWNKILFFCHYYRRFEVKKFGTSVFCLDPVIGRWNQCFYTHKKIILIQASSSCRLGLRTSGLLFSVCWCILTDVSG